MSLTVQLLGRPRLDRPSGQTYQFRGRKSWAVLAFLILSERPPSRARLAAMLFSEADDPARALRWSLAEIRRGLGADGSVEGEPVVLSLDTSVTIDVGAVLRGAWQQAVELPGLGSDLLEGMDFPGATAFAAWLLSEQRRLAAASEALLHEGALGSLSRGDMDAAVTLAVRATAMNPFDENHHALLIRLYRLAGDDERAAKQFAVCTELLDREFGVAPGPAVLAALRETRPDQGSVADPATIEALIEAGSTAVAAGAVQAGVQSLRTAVRLSDGADRPVLRVESRLALAEALVHSLRGFDEEGLAALYQADDIAAGQGDLGALARTRAEIGYVDFLRARYDRAEMRLTDALALTGTVPLLPGGDPSVASHVTLVRTASAPTVTALGMSPSPAVAPQPEATPAAFVIAKATTYLGSIESDRGNYQRAEALLRKAIELSRSVEDHHREVYALSMLGRVQLLSGDLDSAALTLDRSIALAHRDHWLAFLPWPQALRGDVQLARRDRAGASTHFEQAFARACQIGDPCWEGISARGLALVADASGDTERAFLLLADARLRSNRHADPYVWLDGYILDAQCTLGRRHDHPDTVRWIAELRELASRTGMRELLIRSMLHGAALGVAGDAAAASLLAAAFTEDARPSVGPPTIESSATR